METEPERRVTLCSTVGPVTVTTASIKESHVWALIGRSEGSEVREREEVRLAHHHLVRPTLPRETPATPKY